MIHPKEHIALAFAFHAEEYHSLLDRVFQNNAHHKKRGNHGDYIDGILYSYEQTFGDIRLGNLSVRAQVHNVPYRPVVRMKEGMVSTITELSDLAFIVTYIKGNSVVHRSMTLFRVLMNRPEGEIWHVPRRQVHFLANFPTFEFGSSNNNTFQPRMTDRFTGNFWFVSRSEEDFILSALALESTKKNVVRLTEIQNHFRYRTEIALSRQMMGRLGDDVSENTSGGEIYSALRRFVTMGSDTEFKKYATRKAGKTFYFVETDVIM